MSLRRGDKSAWAVLAGGVAIAVGSQFAWVEPFTGWIGYAPLSNTTYQEPGVLGSGAGLGLQSFSFDIGHFRPVLVGCGVLLVALAVSQLSHSSRSRPLAILSLILAIGTASYLGYVLLQVLRFLRRAPMHVTLTAIGPGVWITTIGSIVTFAGALTILVRIGLSSSRIPAPRESGSAPRTSLR